MPAISPNRALRRQLSDEARRILYEALCHGSERYYQKSILSKLDLKDLLEKFSCNARIEIPGVGLTPCAKLVVHGYDIRLSFSSSESAASVMSLNKRGAVYKWVVHQDGQTEQYQDYVSTLEPKSLEHQILRKVIEISELFDIIAAIKESKNARQVGSKKKDSQKASIATFVAGPNEEGKKYVYILDASKNIPVQIRQEQAMNAESNAVILHIDGYRPSTGDTLLAPPDIKTDMQITIDAAMNFYDNWTAWNKTLLYTVFKSLDADDDSYVSCNDMKLAIVHGGRSLEQALHLTTEMSRLVADTEDPTEEFSFRQWAGFWLVMFADGYGVSDLEDQEKMVTLFRQFFFGELYHQDPAVHRVH